MSGELNSVGLSYFAQWRLCAGLAVLLSTYSPYVLAGQSSIKKFQCPSAYQGIKPNMLPSHWESIDQGKKLGRGLSHVQNGFLICIYREPSGKKIGSVRRLIPKGYHCITDGKGFFHCELSKG